MPKEVTPVLAIGAVLDHYQVEERIGSGGMGEVYRAVDQRLGRHVAIKVLKPSLAQDQDRIRRFEQEARAAALLNHPNIVAIYDVGLHDGAPYIVSELLEGKTLREQLWVGALSRSQAHDYSVQITEGLIAAHSRQIVHRDLKPENLFVTRDGRVKILDFGIAKLLQPEGTTEHSVETMTTQTKSGLVLGTVAYMSPEQLRAKPVDHRSDIFSFGSILYEMLCGKRAFTGETEVDTMTAVLKEVPRELLDTEPGLPLGFEPIVRHCLEKEAENRFQSARDLLFALGTMAEHPPGPVVRSFGGRKRGGKRLAAWIATAVLLIAVLGVGLGAYLRKPVNPQYQRITFERGTVYSGRFSPDGRTVIYGASWNGDPMQLYSTIPDSHLARSLGQVSAHLLAVSAGNELALVVNGKHGSRLDFLGTLARSPMVGGSPREVLEDVSYADWSPSGELAAVHHQADRDSLEYPIGKVLYQTTGSISNVRFSPSGEWIAFMDHPVRWDDGGSVCVIGASGQRKTLSAGWSSEDGLAWSPSNEIWFTAVESGSTNRSLWSVSLSRKLRKVLSIPGGFSLLDIARDGRVLVSVYGTERLAMNWTGKGGQPERDLSWYDWTVAKDVSADGKSVLFEANSEALGPDAAIGIRKIDGAPPIHLGDGSVESLSPDGKLAVSLVPGDPDRIRLLPVGPGQPREIPVTGLEHLQSGAHFLPDGRHLIVNGNQAGRPVRSFLVDLSGGTPSPITPEGIRGTLPSPDGQFLAGTDADHQIVLLPIAGGAPIKIPGATSGLESTQWSSDSKGLYVYRSGETPLQVSRLDIKTGALTPVRRLIPQDKAGVVSIFPVVATQDGSQFVYSYYQVLSSLDVITGLK
jgi:dipeptidyl aminopeptidase/acylaminoacyl peptidase